MAEEFWGVDIGGSAVKAVKLRRTNAALEIVAADIVPLKGAASQEISFGRDRRIWIALGELARRNHIGAEPLVVSIPAKATFVRPFEIVTVSGKPIPELVTFEAQQHLPFGLDTVIWDYELFPAAADARERSGVLFAVKKEVVNNYMMSISAGRLAADDLQSSPLALYNFVKYDQQPEEPVLLLDVGATSTNVVLMHDGRYTITSAPAGGDLITRALQDKFKIAPEQADKAKRNVAKLKMAKDVLESMLPAIRKIVSEIEGGVRRLRAGVGDIRPKKALLFGGAAETPGLVTMLSQALECEVEPRNAFGRLAIAEGVDRDALTKHFSELVVACGLALQAAGQAACHISLISATAARRKFAFRSMPYAIAILAVTAALLLWMGGFAEWQVGKLKFAQTVIGKSVDPVDAALKEWNSLAAKSPAEQLLDKYAQFSEDRLCWIKVLSLIKKNILKDTNARTGRDLDKVWLISLTLDKRGGLLRGISWWGMLKRNNPMDDLDASNSLVVAPLKRLPGFGHTDTLVEGGSLRYADVLAPKAPSSIAGRYVVFPVTFDVDIPRMEQAK